jgi:transcriptional regulator with XRE-family HTH domain
MIIRKLRLKRGWSQEQVAEMSGLSVRTVQRAERGQSSSMETLKALAAIFEIDVTSLTEDADMTKGTEEISTEENKALQQVKDIKGFYTHLIQFVVIVSALGFINHMTSPGHYWIVWVIIGWGAGIIAHGLSVFEVFNLFGVEWEKKQIEKRLGRKL